MNLGVSNSNIIIRVENTAISNGVAQSVKDFLEVVPERDSLILDYGAGKLRNTKYLSKNGYKNVTILDTALQMERLSVEDKKGYTSIVSDGELFRNKYNLILCNFVLNVIPEKEIREKVLKNIHNSLSDNGKAIIEVRRNRAILKAKYREDYLDG